MKKHILILLFLNHILIVSAQQWIPDVNKKYSFTSAWQLGTCLLAVNDTLYVGGQFARVSNVNALEIAKYCNGNWHSLKGGLNGSPISFLYKNSNLYIAGDFSWADNKPGTNGLARWDGNNWWPIGSNSSCGAGISALEYYDGKLFAAGNIGAIGSVGVTYVASFDGINWANAGNSSLPPLTNLRRNNADLLACHYSGFMKYEGDTTWSYNPYGGCSNYWKMEKDTINDFLYVAGDFAYICTNPPLTSYGIAMWDGFEWHSFGTNVVNGIGAMKVYNGYLYAAHGSDTLRDGLQINYVARWDWDSLRWYPLGSGFSGGGPNAFEEFHDTLFVTGNFNIAGGDSAYGLARWYMPDTNCSFLRPMIHTLALQDTFHLSGGHVNVQFFNNNAYAQSWQWDFGDLGTANIQNPVHNFTNDSTYHVTVTVTEDGCTKSDTITIHILSGGSIDEYTKENLNFKVYPNPTGGDFTIECTLPHNKTGEIRVYRTDGSALGKKTLESGYNKLIMPSSNWKESVLLVGVYVEGKQVLVEKVVKQ